MSASIADILNVALKPKKCIIRVINGAAKPYFGITDSVPTRLGIISVNLDFPMVQGLPYDVIIGSPMCVRLKAKLNMYK